MHSDVLQKLRSRLGNGAFSVAHTMQFNGKCVHDKNVTRMNKWTAFALAGCVFKVFPLPFLLKMWYITL